MDETPGRSDPSEKAEALLEAGCLTTVPGYCDGGPPFVAAGFSTVLSINKTTRAGRQARAIHEGASD
jgi:hypothetical protein